MTKIFRVTRAELLKQISKVGTWIIVGVIGLYCLLSGGVSLLSSLFLNDFDSFQQEIEYIDEQLEMSQQDWMIDEMDFATQAEKDMYIKEQEEYRAGLKERRANYQWLLDREIAPGDWRAMALLDEPGQMMMDGPIAAGLIDEAGIKTVIEKQDWAQYMDLLIRLAEMNEAAAGTSPTDGNRLSALLRLQLEKNLQASWAYGEVENILLQSNSIEMEKDSLATMTNKTFSDRFYIRQAQESIRESEKQIQISRYRLENNVAPVGDNDFFSFMMNFAGPSILILIVILLMTNSVCSEFSSGTIKILAITPYKRWKLLYGKFLAVIILAMGYMLIQYWLMSAVGLLFHGLPAGGQYVDIWGGRIVVLSPSAMLGLHMANTFNVLLIVASFAMMIACLIRNGVWTTVITLGVYFLGNTVLGVLTALPNPLALAGRFWLFANTNLLQYSSALGAAPRLTGMSLGFSLTTLTVYMIVFHFVSSLSVSRRPISA